MYEAPSVESLEVNLQSLASGDKKQPMYMQVSNSVKRKGNNFRGIKFSAIAENNKLAQ